MDTNEVTSIGLASLASRGFLDPVCLRADEKRSLCVSVLAQAPDRSADIAHTVIDRSLLELAHQLRSERTSAEIASMAAGGIDNPSGLSWGEIRLVCASVLTQVPDHKAEITSGLADRLTPGTLRRNHRRPAVSFKSRKKPAELPENRGGLRANVPAE